MLHKFSYDIAYFLSKTTEKFSAVNSSRIYRVVPSLRAARARASAATRCLAGTRVDRSGRARRTATKSTSKPLHISALAWTELLWYSCTGNHSWQTSFYKTLWWQLSPSFVDTWVMPCLLKFHSRAVKTSFCIEIWIHVADFSYWKFQ